MSLYYLTVTYILAGMVGLCVGSFLNVVIYRVPEKMSLAYPSSHCPQCGYQLKWYDNIPVLSYIILGGKCRKCKQHIPFRYTAVEILNTVLWLLCAFVYAQDAPIYAVINAIVCSLLICVAFIDLEHMLIFDRFQIMLAVLAVISIFFDKDFAWYSHLIGAVCGFLVFWGVGAAVTKAKGQDALGGGDIKLAGVMGLFLGWQKLLLAMLIASVVASVYLMILSKKDPDKQYPFGPFLAVGFTVAGIFGNVIISGYLDFIMKG